MSEVIRLNPMSVQCWDFKRRYHEPMAMPLRLWRRWSWRGFYLQPLRGMKHHETHDAHPQYPQQFMVYGIERNFHTPFFFKTCRASILSFFCCRALLFQWKLLNYRPQKGVAPSFLSVSSVEAMEEVIHSPVTQGFTLECQLQDVGLSLLNESFSWSYLSELFSLCDL